MEVTNVASENRLGIDFSELYQQSELSKRAENLVEELSVPAEGSEPLSFKTEYARTRVAQIKTIVWKNNRTYWRTPGEWKCWPCSA